MINKYNSIVFTLMILICTLEIQANNKMKNYEMALVNKETIDLHSKANLDSKKELNRFKYNDTIKIYYCNSYHWCKTDGGYVKQYLLKFSSPKEKLKKDGIIRTTNSETKMNSKWNNEKLFFRRSVDENVMDILIAIALQNGSQIIFDKGISGVETMSIENMPLEAAFNLILQRNNLESKWEGNTLIINNIKDTQIKKEFIILKSLTIPTFNS